MFKFSSGCVRDSGSWECRCCCQNCICSCNNFLCFVFIVSPFHLIIIDVLFFLTDLVNFIVLASTFHFPNYLYILLLMCLFGSRMMAVIDVVVVLC